MLLFFRLKLQLLPSLISICFRNDHNLASIRQEISTTLLCDLLKTAISEKEHLDTSRLVANCNASIGVMDQTRAIVRETDPGILHDRTSLNFLRSLSLRFPAEFWMDALEYFKVKK